MQDMPMRAVSDLVGEWDTRLWRVLDHYVTEARDQRSLAPVTAFGVDETAAPDEATIMSPSSSIRPNRP